MSQIRRTSGIRDWSIASPVPSGRRRGVELVEQPEPSDVPVARHLFVRHPEGFGRLLDAEAAEVAQFHDVPAPGISMREAAQRLVQRKEIFVSRRHLAFAPRRLHLPGASAPFQRSAGARAAHEDAAHQPRAHGVEVRAIPPLDAAGVDEPVVSFVDERRGLQRVPRPFTAPVVMGQAMEFGRNDREELVEGVRIVLTPGDEECRDLNRPGCGLWCRPGSGRVRVRF